MLILLVISLPLVGAEIKEELEPKINELNKDNNLAKYKIFLPLTIKISSEKEEFSVKINKDGNVAFADENKIDITIRGKEDDLTKILNSDENDLEDYIKNINVYGVSFKGKVAVIIGEKIFKTKFNKNKALNDKILGAVVYPLTLFLKN